MTTSQDILVIILSTALAVLLVLAIAVTVAVLQILRAVKRLTAKAEHVVENAEHVSQVFSNATGSMALFKIVRNIAEMASKRAARDKKKD